MKKLLGLFLAIALSVYCAFATDTYIESVVQGGKIILTPEYVIRIMDYDTITTSLWLPVTDIVVTSDRVINVDDNESADIESIRYR